MLCALGAHSIHVAARHHCHPETLSKGMHQLDFLACFTCHHGACASNAAGGGTVQSTGRITASTMINAVEQVNLTPIGLLPVAVFPACSTMAESSCQLVDRGQGCIPFLSESLWSHATPSAPWMHWQACSWHCWLAPHGWLQAPQCALLLERSVSHPFVTSASSHAAKPATQ